MKRLIYILIILTFFACASRHEAMRGTVAMKINDREAHVCLGKGEVKKGDRVTVFLNECDKGARPDKRGTPCVLKKAGEGRVIEILNDHYSVVKFNRDVQFEEGTLVEKNK